MKPAAATPFMAVTLVTGTAACLGAPYHETPPTADYRCLFNHELLIVSHKKDNSPAYIESFMMNYVTYQNSKVSTFARRYTTFEIYRASALNLFHRGVDGLSLFNYDYVPSETRLAMAEGLKGITDVEYLKTTAKDYAVYPGFGTFPATDAKAVELIIPDDTREPRFERALLRVETQESCADLRLGVWVNGRALQECEHEGIELFPPIAQNAAYATRDRVRFYTLPLEVLIPGRNSVRIENLDRAKRSCRLFSMEIGLYRRPG